MTVALKKLACIKIKIKKELLFIIHGLTQVQSSARVILIKYGIAVFYTDGICNVLRAVVREKPNS